MEARPNKYYFNLLKQHKDVLQAKYGVSRIGIFGSVARGMHNSESDIDVCIEMKQPDMMNFVGVYSDLENLFGKKNRRSQIVQLCNLANADFDYSSFRRTRCLGTSLSIQLILLKT